MRLKALLVAITAFAVVGLMPPAAQALGSYTPPPGAQFNNPRGSSEARNRLIAHVRRSIDSVPRNGVIRIALYSNDRQDVADALLRACRRHVSVQMVINNNNVSRATRRQLRHFGPRITPKYWDACHPVKKPANPKAPNARKPYPIPSFVVICDGACRLGGHASNQHMKFMLFSSAAKAKSVVMFGSTNLTGFAANVHWNDLYTIRGMEGLYRSFGIIFEQMARDKRMRKPYQVFQNADITSEFGAKVGATRRGDPVWQRLNKVGCHAQRGYGSAGHTVMRIMMYSWTGNRGMFLAKKVAQLSRSGCRIRAVISGAEGRIRSVLGRAGVSVRSAAIDLDHDKATGFGVTGWEVFSHEKWMALSGTWNGRRTRAVWTGSENWSGVSLHNDEVTVMVPRRTAYASYLRHFDNVYANYTRGRYFVSSSSSSPRAI